MAVRVRGMGLSLDDIPGEGFKIHILDAQFLKAAAVLPAIGLHDAAAEGDHAVHDRRGDADLVRELGPDRQTVRDILGVVRCSAF